jgi:hypothetical protein
MKAARIHRYGPPDAISFEEVDLPDARRAHRRHAPLHGSGTDRTDESLN